MPKDGSGDGLSNLRPEAPTHLPASLAFTDKQHLVDHLSSQLEAPTVELGGLELHARLAHRIPRDLAERALVCPVDREGGVLVVAMASPTDVHTVDKLKFLTGCDVVAVRASEEDVLRAIDRLYPA